MVHSVSSISAIDHNIYSEDLFDSDDDFMEDDGLTEPEILAMLDEVECKSEEVLFEQHSEIFSRFLTRSDTNRAVHPQKMIRGLEFGI